jgi:Leucyl-tRNA synthetase
MYNFKSIEKKWQKYWDDNESFKASDDYTKPKQYNLVEFPYPSGVGMHLGHIKAYIGMEVLSRRERMQGYNVLFPMGFDAFGLPAENYAIQVGKHPRVITDENIEIFTNQLKEVGFSFDFSRVVDTTDPNYYKWTQWIFLKLFEHGLAFKDRTYVNFCPKCQVVLSNEDSQGGKCDRCDSDVIQKEKDVWFLRITEYAEKLLEGLDTVDFPSRVRLGQENWIGKSTGAFVDFNIKNLDYALKIYTTRPDTLYGVTFMVVAPEHPLIDQYKDKITNMDKIKAYREKASHKTEFERVELAKDKTGELIEGLSAINPVNGKEIPIYIADYVMMSYGTGAIMAVPAHDERDYEFATKFNISIIPVIEQITGTPRENEAKKESIVAVIYDPKENKYLTINWGDKGGRIFVGGTRHDSEDPIECAKREIAEETGYNDIEFVRETFPINHHYYAHNKDKAFEIDATGLLFNLVSDKQVDRNLDEDEIDNFKVEWVSKEIAEKEINEELHRTVYDNLNNPTAYTGDGKMINSDVLNGLKNKKDSIETMNNYLKENNIGEPGIQYKMKDWAFNRQRYWGEPIPIVYCDSCGMVPMKYEDLPLELPEMEDFKPGPDGESPLINATDWVNCKCPTCGGEARRETDTMPQWAGSSWYYLRYLDPTNSNEIASKEAMEYWMNVDVYNGGAEHITRHLIYSRFWHRFLYDIGIVNTKEPYQKRTTTGLILGSDGSKMSKSKGNTVNPSDVVREYGADVLRCYVLFMGDYAEEAPWNEAGVKGINRFLDRIYKLQEIVTEGNEYSKEFISMIHKTIKKVTEDIDNLKYNTAISELMKMINAYYDKGSITKKDYEVLVTLLYPFAPHLAEEMNQILGNESLTVTDWPIHDERKTIDDTYEMVVQVNGKLRGKIEVATTTTKEEMESLAQSIDNVKSFIAGSEIVKIIVVPKKLVNIVIK